MSQRCINLSTRHDSLLKTLSTKIGATFVNTVERGLEALEEKEAQRDREIANGK